MSDFYTLLQSRMKEQHVSMTTLAEHIGIAKSTLSQIFNRTSEWRLPYIYDTCDLLDIPMEHIQYYWPRGGMWVGEPPKEKERSGALDAHSVEKVAAAFRAFAEALQ